MQYDPKVILPMIPGATKVVFGAVNYKFAAIFHMSASEPTLVNRAELCKKIEALGTEVVCAPPAPAHVNHDFEVPRPSKGCMYHTPNAGKRVREACKNRGYTFPLTVAIFQSPETQDFSYLTVRIATSGTIPLTAEEVHELTLSTECPYARVVPSARSL